VDITSSGADPSRAARSRTATGGDEDGALPAVLPVAHARAGFPDPALAISAAIEDAEHQAQGLGGRRAMLAPRDLAGRERAWNAEVAADANRIDNRGARVLDSAIAPHAQ
jgi:hypothetical protein